MERLPTITGLLAARVEASAERPALWTWSDDGPRQDTWQSLAVEIGRLAGGLRQAGVVAGDRVAQCSENRREWLLTDLAVQLVGGVHVPLHASLTASQIAQQVRHSGARMLICSTHDQWSKLASGLANGTSASTTEGEAGGDGQTSWLDGVDLGCFGYEPTTARPAGQAVRPWQQLLAPAGPDDAQLVTAGHVSSPDSLATILYTSGTTGEPKGVMLSQGNLASNALAALEVFVEQPDDRRLNFLPLSHVFARTCDLYTWIASGGQLALAPSREAVLPTCQTFRPTLLNGVPYFFEKLQQGLEKGRERQGAVPQGALRQLLGGDIRACCSGGAPLPDHVHDFFHQQGVPLVQGYGLSETSPVITVSTVAGCRRGSVGQALRGIQVRIAEDGEILTRGPHVMQGYYRNALATAEVIRDSWLHTGDLGRLDPDGYLYITGRKKELIVTSGGKNIVPGLVENLLTRDPLIEQALVVGDRRNYLAALIVPDWEALTEAVGGLGERTQAALDQLQVRELYAQRIAAALDSLSHYEQIGRFRLIPLPFTVERGELTAKLSLRRDVICDHYAAVIETLYG